MTLEQSKDWSIPPWDITGEKLTYWRRFVWRYRYEVYSQALNERYQRIKNGR